jgi:hypothetical protein
MIGVVEKEFIADAKALSGMRWESNLLGERDLKNWAKSRLLGLAEEVLREQQLQAETVGEESLRHMASAHDLSMELGGLYDVFDKFSLVQRQGYGYIYDEARSKINKEKTETPDNVQKEMPETPQVSA